MGDAAMRPLNFCSCLLRSCITPTDNLAAASGQGIASIAAVRGLLSLGHYVEFLLFCGTQRQVRTESAMESRLRFKVSIRNFVGDLQHFRLGSFQLSSAARRPDGSILFQVIEDEIPHFVRPLL